MDEELQEQRGLEGAHSAPLHIEHGDTHVAHGGEASRLRTISDDMQDLSLLRDSVRQNLIARPVDSPLSTSGSLGSFGSSDSYGISPRLPLQHVGTISIQDALRRLSSEPGAFVLDTRPFVEFVDAHLPRSTNLSIPSLIFKRFCKMSGRVTTWDTLGSFVNTPAGRSIWEAVDTKSAADIFILGLTGTNEPVRILSQIVRGILSQARVEIISGGWASVLSYRPARKSLVAGEHSDIPATVALSPISEPAPPLSPRRASVGSEAKPVAATRIPHHPSMPLLRPNGAQKTRRNVPALSIHVDTALTNDAQQTGSRRPPKLSLNLDRPDHKRDMPKGPATAFPHGSLGRRRSDLSPRSYPQVHTPSFQALCHQQSARPPSPSSFGLTSPESMDRSSFQSLTASPDGSQEGDSFTNASGSITARHGISPFIVSTILPNFLFLGPEITSQEEVEALKALGIRRVLNVAVECDDEELKLRQQFERYLKLPMRDIVEESGVAKGMRDACEFLGESGYA